jgi:hypothetical protein
MGSKSHWRQRSLLVAIIMGNLLIPDRWWINDLAVLLNALMWVWAEIKWLGE